MSKFTEVRDSVVAKVKAFFKGLYDRVKARFTKQATPVATPPVASPTDSQD